MSDNLNYLLPRHAQVRWALVAAGFIVNVADSFDRACHPFGDLAEGQTALRVTGVPCDVGYLVDHKGNVAPPNGRTEPLHDREPAYHDRGAVPAVPTAVLAARVHGDQPHSLETSGDAGEGAAG